jgi:hypothetical protein
MTDFCKMSPVPSFTKICLARATLIHVERQMERHDETNGHFCDMLMHLKSDPN